MNVRIEESWKKHLQTEFDKPYFDELVRFVRNEYATHTVYPPGKQMFAAFDACPFDNVKVVILGQDPYHVTNRDKPTDSASRSTKEYNSPHRCRTSSKRLRAT